MAKVAKKRLSKADFLSGNRVKQLRCGSITDNSAFFDEDGRGKTYHLIFCYDVIQQLPFSLRKIAIDKMLSHLFPQGTLIIFDSEFWSLYGIKMALKKIITRYTPIDLVPSFYCLAKYPSLRFYRLRMILSGFKAEVIISKNGKKRAIVIQKPVNIRKKK
jgi:hypothetical protein